MKGHKIAAGQVRTGDTITTAWAPHRTLTVDYPTWEWFTNPEGWTGNVIRFTGVDNFGQRVERGWGHGPNDRVYLIKPAPHDGDTFGGLA